MFNPLKLIPGGEIGLLIVKVIFGLIIGFAVVTMVSSQLDTVKGWFGFETKETLKRDNNILKKDIAVLDSVSKGNQDAVVIATESSKQKEAAVDKLDNKNVKVEKIVADHQATTEQKEKEVLKKPISEEQKAVEISQLRIDDVWSNYCSFNEDGSCNAAQGEKT